MGFYNKNWIVTFDYSKGIFSSKKRGTIIVEGHNDYSAKSKAKSILKGYYSSVTILSVVEVDSKGRQIDVSSPLLIKEEKTQNIHSQTCTRKLTEEEKEERLLEMMARKAKLEKEKKEKKIAFKIQQIKNVQKYPQTICLLFGVFTAFAFLIGWFPRWFFLLEKVSASEVLDLYLDGYGAITDKTAKDLLLEIDKYIALANSIIWLPFLLLGIGIVITIIAYFVTKKRLPLRIKKLNDELSEIKN